MRKGRSLHNKRIVVTRSEQQADDFCAKLERLGAICIRFPTIQFVPLPTAELDNALSQLELYDWLIFTSENGVRFFMERLEIGDWRLEHLPKIATVGTATQKLLTENGIPVDFVPDKFMSEQMVLGLGDIANKRILLPRAKIGRPELVTMLTERGAVVDDIALYDTVTAVPTPEACAELAKGVDVLTFTSPSTVRNFLTITRPQGFQKPLGSLVAVIGSSTAAEAKKLGLTVDIMPAEHTIDGLVTAVAQYMQSGAGSIRRLR